MGIGLGALQTSGKTFQELISDSEGFATVIESAVQIMYSLQPGGLRNYREKEPALGRVVISQRRRELNGLELEFYPSPFFQRKLKYTGTVIARLDVGERSYTPMWDRDYNEHGRRIPPQVMIDTENVMASLGLERRDF